MVEKEILKNMITYKFHMFSTEMYVGKRLVLDARHSPGVNEGAKQALVREFFGLYILSLN